MESKIRSAFVWSFIQRFGTQFVEVSVSILLTRILLPEEFGLIGMIMIVIVVAQSLTDAGMTSSLIRKKEADNLDYSTVFYLNIAVGFVVYGLIYLIAPLVSEFYEEPLLTDLLRVFSLTIIINAFTGVQSTIYRKNLDFKFLFRIGITTSIVSGAVGLYMALHNFGVWSLVCMHIVKSLMGCILYWTLSPWKPSYLFSVARLKEHFSFGINLTVSSLLNRVFDNIYYVTIGKYFSATQLGFYTRANTFKQIPINNLLSAVNGAAYPVLSSVQDDSIRLKSVYKRIMKQIIFLIAPTMIGAIVLSKALFVILFTEKWLEAVPYFQVLCLAGILYPVHSYNLNILKVKGRSDLFLKLEVVKKIILLISVILAIPFGIMALLYSQLFLSVVLLGVNAFYSKRFVNYGLSEQVLDILPSILLALIMGVVVYLLDRNFFSHFSNYASIIFGGFTGILVYFSLSFIFKFESLFEIINLFKSRTRKFDSRN